MFWIAPGTICMYPVIRGPSAGLLPPALWRHDARPWYGEGALHVVRHGRAHSIVHLWRDGGFAGWYVNLQDPLRPSRLGFDTRDHALDLWVAADGTISWQDEDDAEEQVAAGVLPPDLLTAARREGETVLEEWPFPTGWEDFRPPASWPVPDLPPDWHTL